MTATAPIPVDLDAVAGAITSDLLSPYIAPQRPISLGTPATYCMRVSYGSRMDGDDGTRAQLAQRFIAADAPTHNAVRTLAQRIATALGATVLSDIDWLAANNDSTRTSGLQHSVVLCVDVLSRLANPAPALALLSTLLTTVPAAVIAVPLREFTATTDDPGPPERPDRVREWSFPEMQALLDASGLDVVFGGVLPASATASSAQHGVFVAVACHAAH